MTVTNMRGATLPGVHVEISGPTNRMGETDPGGQINFAGLQAGTYRIVFSGEEVIAFEREVTLRAGQVTDLDITLNPAPPPREVQVQAPAPAAAAAPAAGAKGQPQSLVVTDVLEKEFVGRQPRRETLLSCSGNERTTMIQLNEPLPERLYQDADVVYYVLGGEGTLMLAGKETRLALNGFASVPRGTSHSMSKRGNRALIVLAVLSGEPCEQPK